MGDRVLWNLEAGLGGRLQWEHWFLKLDLSGGNLREGFRRDGGRNLHGKLRLWAGYRLTHDLAVFAGGSANLMLSWEGRQAELAFFRPDIIHRDGDYALCWWLGAFAGIQFQIARPRSLNLQGITPLSARPLTMRP